MEKALALVLFTISYGIVSGQFCPDLPSESTIAENFAEQLQSLIPESSSMRFYNNCIAYDGASRNYAEATFTVQYTTGSSIFTAQGRYVCREETQGTPPRYVWSVMMVMLHVGTRDSQLGCMDCSSTSDTTCTSCDASPCGQNGSPDMYCTGCICNVGYTGANCSTDIDECASTQPCEGGANCTNTIGSFNCTCPDPCLGPDCSACCSSPCKKGGTCSSNNPATFTCTCPPGFSGLTCTEFLGGCFSDPCMNGGECVDVFDVNNPLAYRCSCPMGFTGADCESRIDYCASQPCRHSGWCTSMTTGYTCTCLQGYTGSDCSQPLRTCLSNPAVCGSNGLCSSRRVDNIPTSYCSCYPGYMGVFCEQQITSCVDDYAPCLHQGACNNQLDGTGNVSFSCNCTVGNWAGFYCTDCGLRCINGNLNGICTKCDCNDPWIGNSCDEIRNCTSYDNVTGNCQSCEGGLMIMNNSCIAGTNPDDSNTAETVGIILGCVAGAGIILTIVFVLLFVALRYVQLSGVASMRKDDPALLDKQQARLSGFFAPKSTLFSSGGHTGGIRTGLDSSFPSYKEMVNEEVNPPAEDDVKKPEYQNASPAARSNLEEPEYEDVNPDDEWLPPPDDD